VVRSAVQRGRKSVVVVVLVGLAGLVAVGGACGGPATSPGDPRAPAAPGLRPAGDESSCARDDECSVEMAMSCCGCPDGPHAVNERRWKERMDGCDAVQCAVSVSCAHAPGQEGAPAARATCRAGRCELAR
jgi:hypothetical protein